ncbi:MAG: MAPEG family protein [Pseudomonadales bacterium]|nr:MAPEG family protein [Pseudomonadales bacterium]
MELVTIVTMLAIIEAAIFGLQAGLARAKGGVQAPAITGDELFERRFRVHYNTIEQLIVFIPALWAFGHYVGQYWAAGLGAVFLVGRIVYAVSYVKDPATRGLGFAMSSLPSFVMAVGALIAATISLFAG